MQRVWHYCSVSVQALGRAADFDVTGGHLHYAALCSFDGKTVSIREQMHQQGLA